MDVSDGTLMALVIKLPRRRTHGASAPTCPCRPRGDLSVTAAIVTGRATRLARRASAFAAIAAAWSRLAACDGLFEPCLTAVLRPYPPTAKPLPCRGMKVHFSRDCVGRFRSRFHGQTERVLACLTVAIRSTSGVCTAQKLYLRE